MKSSVLLLKKTTVFLMVFSLVLNPLCCAWTIGEREYADGRETERRPRRLAQLAVRGHEKASEGLLKKSHNIDDEDASISQPMESDFTDGALSFFHKLPMTLDEQVGDLHPYTWERQDLDPSDPDALEALSMIDHDRGLVFEKEAYIGKNGDRRVCSFDLQADVSFTQTPKGWKVQEPYAFGYTQNLYEDLSAVEKRLAYHFAQRLLGFRGTYRVHQDPSGDFWVQKKQGFLFPSLLENHGPYDLYEAHGFLRHSDSAYDSYLYDHEVSHTKARLAITLMQLTPTILSGVQRVMGPMPPLLEESLIDENRNNSIQILSQNLLDMPDAFITMGLMLAAPKLAFPYVFFQMHTKKGVQGADYESELKSLCQSAEQGNASAQSALGLMYKDGKGVDRDYKEAVRWFQKSAEQGNGNGQSNLGVMCKYGLGVERDYKEAIKWFRESAEQGNGNGQSNLGLMYKDGKGIEQDYEEAVRWFQKSADQGNGNGQSNLGIMYKDGLGVEQNYEEAVKWFRKSVKQNNTFAQSNLGLIYKGGLGVEKNDKEAVGWFLKSAKRGNAYGQSNLGLMYKYGRGVERDYEEAIKWFRESAEQGNMHGQYNMARMYSEGRGVEQDYKKSADWYRKAATGGMASAWTVMGLLYEAGKAGLGEDMKQARLCFEKASRLGEPDAQYRLATFYMRGLADLDYNVTKAFDLFSQAADQNHLEASHELGVLYKRGLGAHKKSKPNLKEAVRYLTRGVKQRYEPSIDFLHDMIFFAEGTIEDYLPLSQWLIQGKDQKDPKEIFQDLQHLAKSLYDAELLDKDTKKKFEVQSQYHKIDDYQMAENFYVDNKKQLHRAVVNYLVSSLKEEDKRAPKFILNLFKKHNEEEDATFFKPLDRYFSEFDLKKKLKSSKHERNLEQFYQTLFTVRGEMYRLGLGAPENLEQAHYYHKNSVSWSDGFSERLLGLRFVNSTGTYEATGHPGDMALCRFMAGEGDIHALYNLAGFHYYNREYVESLKNYDLACQKEGRYICWGWWCSQLMRLPMNIPWSFLQALGSRFGFDIPDLKGQSENHDKSEL